MKKKKKPKENMIARCLRFIKEKPWYVWLSAPAFMSFFFISMAQSKWSDGSVFKCWWNLTWVTFVVLLLPVFIIFMVVAQVLRSMGVLYFSLPSADLIGATIVMYLSVYVFGVLAICVHVSWREKTIAPRQKK